MDLDFEFVHLFRDTTILFLLYNQGKSGVPVIDSLNVDGLSLSCTGRKCVAWMNLHATWRFVAVSTVSVSEGATNKTLS